MVHLCDSVIVIIRVKFLHSMANWQSIFGSRLQYFLIGGWDWYHTVELISKVRSHHQPPSYYSIICVID